MRIIRTLLPKELRGRCNEPTADVERNELRFEDGPNEEIVHRLLLGPLRIHYFRRQVSTGDMMSLGIQKEDAEAAVERTVRLATERTRLIDSPWPQLRLEM